VYPILDTTTVYQYGQLEKKMYKRQCFCLTGIIFLFLSFNANAIIIPGASKWSTDITTISERGSPVPSTSVSDLVDGIEFHYEALSGGRGVGTSLQQYDFFTTTTTGGLLNFDVIISAFTGFFVEELSLGITKNDIEIERLIPFTRFSPSNINMTFEGIEINLDAGDKWGVRVKAGNFTACCGVNGDIHLIADPTGVPAPSTGILAMLGIGLLGWLRREKLNFWQRT